MQYLTELLNKFNESGIRLRFAIGAARNKEEIALLPELIAAYGDLCNACVNVPLDENGVLDNELIEQICLCCTKKLQTSHHVAKVILTLR